MKFIEKDILEDLKSSWGWAINNPVKVLAVNSMANVLVLDDSELLWRICPEELSCEVVAKNHDEMNELFQDNEAKADWQLLGMMDETEIHFGTLEAGKCYGMTIPAVLGGRYEVSNMNIVSIKDYLGLTGDMAMQIKDLPDGKKVVLKIQDQ